MKGILIVAAALLATASAAAATRSFARSKRLAVTGETQDTLTIRYVGS